MEINWKEKAKELIIGKKTTYRYIGDDKSEYFEDISVKDCIKAMIDLAKLACQEQKKICAENAKTKYTDMEEIDEDSILNAPTVKFE